MRLMWLDLVILVLIWFVRYVSVMKIMVVLRLDMSEKVIEVIDDVMYGLCIIWINVGLFFFKLLYLVFLFVLYRYMC